MLSTYLSRAKLALTATCMIIAAVMCAPSHAQTTVTVGPGTGTAYQFPINYSFGYSYTQTIYTAAEITAAGGTAGIIHKIKYLPKTSIFTTYSSDWEIYLGHTTKTGFTSKTDWVTLSAMTQVFDNKIAPTLVAGTWMEILLGTPFTWDGVSNLVVAVREKGLGSTMSPNSWGGYTPAPLDGDKGIYYRNHSTNPSPSSPPMANMTSNNVAQIQFGFSVPCAGIPTASLVSSASAICHSTPFLLTASPEGTVGLTYQYQYSTNEGVTWLNLGLPTNANTYSINDQSVSTQYRVIVTCATGGTANSAPITVVQNPSTTCYCVPFTYNYTSLYVTSFSTTGGSVNINKTSGIPVGGYSDFHLTDSAVVYPGDVMNFSIGMSYGYPDVGHAIWIDFNENGLFELSERVAYNSDYSTSPILGSFIIPSSVTPGVKRMRVLGIMGTIEPSNPCMEYNYGEFEDYSLVVKGSPVCAGTPAPGATYANSITLCYGSELELGVTNNPSIGGLNYSWWTSTDEGATWTIIPGATDSTLSVIPVSDALYRALVTCATTGDTASSTPVAIGFYSHIASVTSGAICGSGSITLTATTASGHSVIWYNGTSDTSALAVGETFTTPALSSTTTFYAAPVSYIPITATVGNGYYVTNSGSPVYSNQSPFSFTYGSNKRQMLIRADELSAAGMVAGPIDALSFKVTSPTVGAFYNTFENFAVSVKQSSSLELTSTFETGLSVVWSGNYTPITGLNTFTFSTPVMWDGVSNLVVQTCFSNAAGSVSTSAEVEYDYTSYVSHAIYRVNTFLPTICDATVANDFGDGPLHATRPKMIFNASGTCAGLRVPVTAAVDEPVVVNLGSPVTICAGDVLTLDAGSTASSYVWNTGATTSTIEVSEAGTYQVTVQEGVCSSSSAILISEVAAPVAGAISVTNEASVFTFSAPEASGVASYAWDFGDGTTANTEVATHTFADAGTYNVSLSATNECGEVNTATTSVTVTALGIDQLGGAQHVQVYPNPAQNLTVIETKDAIITSMNVMDKLGRVIVHTQPNASKTVIDVKGMAAGIYTLRIQTNKGISSVKLVVNH